jgi:hypothetical protein
MIILVHIAWAQPILEYGDVKLLIRLTLLVLATSSNESESFCNAQAENQVRTPIHCPFPKCGKKTSS